MRLRPHPSAAPALPGLLLLAILGGCSDDGPSAAPLPSSGGRANGGGALPTGRTPAGDDAGTEGDAATTELDPLAIECEAVEDVGNTGESRTTVSLLNTIRVPEDFIVGRVLTTWDGACTEPELRLSLSDGHCPDGDGHELTFRFAAADVQGGSILLGQNQVQPRGEGFIDVSYVRPAPLRPSGEWGNCAGAVGLLDLQGELTLEDRSHVQGRFQLDLTACDDSGNAAIAISGEFNGQLERGVDQLCP